MNQLVTHKLLKSSAFGRPSYRLFSQQLGTERPRRKARYEIYDGPIVISGISGRFPMSNNMEEFKTNLFNRVEMTSDIKRWHNDEHPERFGFLTCLDQFDANFFNLTPRQAHQIDPQMRLLLEVAFEAIVDAGLSPTELRGSRTGVFCGALGGEASDYNLFRIDRDLAGYLGLGSANFMIPGRISFAFHLQGPSSHLSTACSSSFTAIEAAVNSIILGRCDAAIVTGSNVLLNPQTHLDLMAMNVLARDGRCKTFDESADGFARSEAAVGIIVQKEKDARRRYATIVNIRSNSDGFKHEGLMCPNGKQQESLLKETYEMAGVDPAEISYIDAHGTGTPTGDPQEIEAISTVFCKVPGRKKPLLLGSVKSNMGHAESAAGLSSVAKTIIAIQEGSIPPNLHFKKPKPEQEHLFDGSLQIVTEPTPFDRGLIGISSFGIGGTNYHMILEPGPVRTNAKDLTDLPVLVPMSGRSEDKVLDSIKEASAHARNPEFVYLLQTAFRKSISGHPYRGYGLLKPGETETAITVENCDSAGLRPVWIIFPGMGSQWNEMGKDLMKIEPFAESVRRSRETLKNISVDLDDLLKANNQAIFNDIHYAVLAITSMQIALYDTIKELNLNPEGFIGHSTGEFLCAYADGCFSAEETLLVTDARGRAFKESQKVIGGMASIGMSAEEVKARLPPGVELACNNAAQNVTVSGELEAVTKFAKQLKDEGKFAVVVNSCGIAAHSQHVQDAADLLKKYVADIIKGDRVRSSRWISTSIPEKDWESPLAKYASPEYFDNNLRAPVLFYEALQQVPPKALVVEVSPKGFFQALLKESVPKDCVHVAPMTVKAEDKLSHFYQSVGQMYLSGVDVEMHRLYPSVPLPVSSDTPAIAHLVKWEHEQSWKTHVLDYPVEAGCETQLDLQHPAHAAIAGHKLEDRILYPGTGYLVLAWTHYVEGLGKRPEETSVVLSNVVLKRATILNETRPVPLFSTMLNGSGKFEFHNEGDVVVTGNIHLAPENRPVNDEPPRKESNWMPLNTDDVYKEFRLRGYNYSGLFQGIQKIDNEGKWADIAWTGNWISFLDTMLQTTILSTTSRNMALPIDFEKVTIDPVEFKKHLKEPEPGSEYPTVRVTVHHNQNKVTCPGIELKGLTATIVARKGQRGNLAYEKYTFCPYMENSNLDVEPHMWEMVDLVMENNRSKDLKVVDVFTNKSNSLAALFRHILTLKPLREGDIRMLTLASEAEKMEDKEKQIAPLSTKEQKEQLVPEIAADMAFLDDVDLMNSISETMKPNGFLLLHSQQTIPDETPGLALVSQKTLPNKTMALFRKVEDSKKTLAQVSVDSSDFGWVTELQEILKKPAEEANRVYVTSQCNPNNGILGLVNCLRQEEGGDRIRCIFDPEKTLKLDFQSPDATLQSVIDKDLVVTIFKDGRPGSYRHIPLEAETAGVVKPVEHAYVSTLTPGDLTSLRWIESPLSTNVPKGGKLYNIAYAAMNFRDVLLATTTIPIEPQFSYKGSYMGFEFSGYDEQGNRVMGLAHGKALATSVVENPSFVWKVPDTWTLEEAATVPVVYATVLYAFHTRAQLQPGQSVLIHAGTGGVGQAAIQVALTHGCEVFTTVGTPEKREFIKNKWPQIKDDHIGNSRDTSFEAQFMEVTNGRGVDVVLNSLADDKLMATVRCLAINGKFLEIGVYDAFKNTPLGMRPFLKNIEFHGVELYHIMRYDLSYEKILREMMDAGLASGAIRPLPTHVFESDQIEDAFRFMASGKHMGKILIKVRDEDKSLKEPLNLPAMGRCYFPAEKTYVIVGGLGGLGLEVANWMVERGARNLILTSRSGLTTGYQSLCLRKWGMQGVKVETPVIDLSNREDAESFIKEVSAKHKIGGIFNSALVLRDDVFPNQSVEAFKEVCAPKATVTEHLDELTRKYCPNLDYFVVFSSSACGRGNSDQTNYGWANSVMERICENRMADGLHGLAIQWGVLGQVGVVAEKLFKNMDGSEVLLGTLPQTVDSCLEVLDAALQQKNPVASSIVVAEKGKKKGDKGGLLARMMKIFGIKDIDTLSPDKKLTELGMDSLIGVELKQTLERDYDLPVTKELLLSLTVGDLKAIDSGTFTVEGAGKGGKKANADDFTPFRLHDDCLVKLKAGENGKSVFIVHGVEGNAEVFKPLARSMDADVYAFQFGEHSEEISIPSIAEAYIQELKEIQPIGPYTIAGYSAGSSIAYEMALQLEKKYNDEVSTLIFMDGCPTWEGTEGDLRKSIAMQLANSKNILKDLPEEQRKKFQESISDDIDTNVKLFLDAFNMIGGIEADSKSIERYLCLSHALAGYAPQEQYTGSTVLVMAKTKSDQAMLIPNDDYNVSKRCMGPVARHTVEGDHESFLHEELVQETAAILNDLLNSTGQ